MLVGNTDDIREWEYLTIMAKIKNALLSVFDKTGIVEFAQGLVDLGWNIYSSGGTAKALAAEGIPVTDVATIAGGEAILGHRVVTLSREVCAGYLAQYNEEDLAEMEALGLPYIDLVCFGLYPLKEEIANPDATVESVHDKTDIGGPTALNAGSKSKRIVIGEAADYDRVLQWLREGEPSREEFVRELAAKGFWTTANYYGAAAQYHGEGRYLLLSGELVGECKYGENPYMQPANLYASSTDDPLAIHNFQDVGGDARSFVNMTDVDRSLQVLTHVVAGMLHNFGWRPCVAVGVKHGNPCGVGVGDTPQDAVYKMVRGDLGAIFGGVVMTNFPITEKVVDVLMERAEGEPPALFDGIVAPFFHDGVASRLERKGGKCRMLVNPALADLDSNSLDGNTRVRPVRGAFLTQPNYTFVLDITASEVHGSIGTTGQQRHDLVVAWAIGCVSNSNTITIVRDGQLLGNGVGQQDRVGAALVALMRAERAGHDVAGAVAWSDSFFPFPDGPQVLMDAGIGAIFASSGSMRDSEVISACNEGGIAFLTQPDKEVRGFAWH